MSAPASSVRPAPDRVLVDIADYVIDYRVQSPLAYETARNCLIDTLGCGLEALEYPACTKLLGPVVQGTVVPNGAKVPGTQFQLDPVQAAFNIGAMIRWLDFNDTWLAAEWGHPSDNLGGILATADWLSRNAIASGKKSLLMRERQSIADVALAAGFTHQSHLARHMQRTTGLSPLQMRRIFAERVAFDIAE